MFKKILGCSIKTKIMALVVAGLVAGSVGCAAANGGPDASGAENAQGVEGAGAPEVEEGMAMLTAQWPDSFFQEEYIEPEFNDEESRGNNAFNVADFGEQGNNGWFYRYGNPDKPHKSKLIEIFDGESYHQKGADGLEIKKDFIHTAEGIAPILEWRAAEQGKVNLKLTYVKGANGDKNPSWPDGVCIMIYKDRELLERHSVEVKVESETLLETAISDIALEEDESLYIVVDPMNNNAYDGGALYVAIADVNATTGSAAKDDSRTDNNANNVKDYGEQGSNGWYYMYGKDVTSCALVSDKTGDGYINNTSPGLVISEGFIHPAINDNAILAWAPAISGPVEIRGKYEKFENNDGNPDWPDGVTVSVYLNSQKLFSEKVLAPLKGTNEITFREKRVDVTPEDRLYFVVSADDNSSYDGGSFQISILDRDGMVPEDAVAAGWGDARQNIADVSIDFGAQGSNGWYYQEGYQDEPFDGYNIKKFEDDKYADDSWLEIKRDFVNTGEEGKSAVIKWKVAQNGDIKIDASYTKFKNEDKNPSWPDGTRVTLYHNSTALLSEEFPADVNKEITKDLNVKKLSVKKGDFITMVVNGKDNNAYDGGSYTFAIDTLSGIVGKTEDDIIVNEDDRTNNACVFDDFGDMGRNGWFYQYGYRSDPFYAVNVESYTDEDFGKYVTEDGIEIKKDYIMPSTKDKSANVKWKVARDGKIDIYADYTKLKNEDKNPSWPDGTDVTLFHNGNVLTTHYFEPSQEEVTVDLSVFGVEVKKGDYITLLVNGRKNTAYDGGLYHFLIEEADDIPVVKVNNSRENRANLEYDFGEQGSNGWYYLEGESVQKSNILTRKSRDGEGYASLKYRSKDLEVKSNFVSPGSEKKAMYQWVVARNGSVDVTGKYIKFGHNDSNPDWPDGTEVSVYLNNELLHVKSGHVSQGDGNDNTSYFDLNGVRVKRGDLITFVIDPLKNNAWDGGRLGVQIKPHSSITYKPGPDNVTNLEADFGEQGSDGWYYGFGNKSADFKPADKNGDEYRHIWYDQLLLKRDGVHPALEVGAIYRWVVAEDGKIDLSGGYYKARNEGTENTPDGVRVAVYKNGSLVEGMNYNVSISKKEEIAQLIEKTGLDVKRGDKLDFIIFAKKNSEWDYGRFAMSINSPVEEKPDDDNVADLYDDFGAQGSKGWYYGYGDTSGAFKQAVPSSDGEEYSGGKKTKLKKDGVEPSKGAGAIYRWIAGEDGLIDLLGEYIKSKNESGNDIPDGVKVAVYKNGTLIEGMSYDIAVFADKENKQEITKKALEVSRGDKIDFIITAKDNDDWDWGALSMTIKPHVEDDPNRENKANLKADFKETQGNNGWYYGSADWDATKFKELKYDARKGKYAGTAPLEVGADYVHPGAGLNAAYKWIAAKDGKIQITGEYVKFANAAGANANGVCLRIFKNAGQTNEQKWIGDGINHGGITEDVTVFIDAVLDIKEGDEILFLVNPEGDDSYDGGRLAIDIKPYEEGSEPDPEPEPDDRTNDANLEGDFSEKQGNNGWHYGSCEWDGTDFTELECNNGTYIGDDNLQVGAKWIHPGKFKNAAYKWVVAEDGTISITGEYHKYANDADPDANGVCMRIFLNGAEKKWLDGSINKGGLSSDVEVSINETLEVKKGDSIIFAVDCNGDGNNSYDGGWLAIQIHPSTGQTDPDPENPNDPDPDEPKRTNNASLAGDFGGTQGEKGWYYGSAEWDGKNFTEESWSGDKYKGADALEVGADWVHPGQWKCATYKWVAAEDGTIRISGAYTKYPNNGEDGANGVTLRIVRDPDGNRRDERFFGGDIQKGDLESDTSVDINETFEVKAGESIVFAVNSEGNTVADGGKLSITIASVDGDATPAAVKEEGTTPPDTDTAEKEGADKDVGKSKGEGASEDTEDGIGEDTSDEDAGNVGEDADLKEEDTEEDAEDKEALEDIVASEMTGLVVESIEVLRR